jgi:hypothetical protein
MHCPKSQFGTDDVIYRRDGSAPVPDDEPVFLTRGKDQVGLYAIMRYIEVMGTYPEPRLAQEHAWVVHLLGGDLAQHFPSTFERVGMGCHTCEQVDHREKLDLSRITQDITTDA